MNEPTVQIAVPAFSRAMRTISAVLGGLWLVEAVIFRSGPAGATDPLGPLGWLPLVPARVADGQVWRLVTYALLHDPQSFTPLLWTVLGLWFFGGSMEARWGGRKLAIAAVASTLLGAVTVTLTGLLYRPFWVQPSVSPAAFTAMLAGAWGMAQAQKPMSFLGIVTLTGRQFTALTAVVVAIGFLLSRSPESVLSMVGLLVGAVLGNPSAARPSRSRRDSGPSLRVIRGGASAAKNLPN